MHIVSWGRPTTCDQTHGKSTAAFAKYFAESPELYTRESTGGTHRKAAREARVGNEDEVAFLGESMERVGTTAR
jgi:hypothetical protein